jgi:OOP family OmpA-OmpF porin
MRLSLAFLTLTLASGALLAADDMGDYHWVQIQGGITGHRLDGAKDQPAFGVGVGTWIDGHWGVEGSALATRVNYGYGTAKEFQADGSVLFNPFSTPSTVRPFLRIGVGPTRIGSPISGTGAYTTRLSGVAGVGIQALAGQRMFFTLEARMVEVETRSTRKEGQALAGVGIRWGNHPTMAAAYTAPAEVVPAPAEAPAPEPQVVVVPVAAATQEYCTILDLQFDINKDAIQREDKEKLAVLGTFMTKYPATTAVIEGHSDNVGADDHNMKLSKARADSVVAYLVDTLHIDASRLSAVGYGDTRPVADNGTELGKRRNRRIDAVIACVTDVEGLAVAPARMTMALAIDFDRNQDEVKPAYDGELRKVAGLMKANPALTASVEGHTGNLQATPQLAMRISRRRAQNVVNYLVTALGVDRSRLTVEGFGDTRRFAYNTSAEGSQENRRVNIIFNYPQP